MSRTRILLVDELRSYGSLFIGERDCRGVRRLRDRSQSCPAHRWRRPLPVRSLGAHLPPVTHLDRARRPGAVGRRHHAAGPSRGPGGTRSGCSDRRPSVTLASAESCPPTLQQGVDQLLFPALVDAPHRGHHLAKQGRPADHVHRKLHIQIPAQGSRVRSLDRSPGRSSPAGGGSPPWRNAVPTSVPAATSPISQGKMLPAFHLGHEDAETHQESDQIRPDVVCLRYLHGGDQAGHGVDQPDLPWNPSVGRWWPCRPRLGRPPRPC